jgi:hypothetical protein
MTRDGNYGPGFRRMLRNAGPAALEALRQDTLAAQARAKEDARYSREITESTDREWYKDYPAPKGPGRKRRAK